MSNMCPICELTEDGFVSFWTTNRLTAGIDCAVCGRFEISTTTTSILAQNAGYLAPVMRASISHRLRLATDCGSELLMVTSDWIQEDQLPKLVLPTPAQQATNIIRFIGDETRHTGQELQVFPVSFHATVGSPNRDFAMHLVFELKDQGRLRAMELPGQTLEAQYARLTLAGWQQYQDEKDGKIAGTYGFIALKFNDDVLDPFLAEHIKPAIAEIGFELRDMRDSSKAGIIDNLMRVEIRDSAFVLVDLTHDNPGAYWEAGYAEGLGKPVLYICEKSKFDDAKTHFDTNHCTTVLWEAGQPDEFRLNLIATLRRSLIL